MSRVLLGPRKSVEALLTGWVTFYHGTSSRRAANIRRNGLTAPGGTNEWRFMLTESRTVAKAYADWASMREKRQGPPVVLRVRIPRDRLREFLFPKSTHISASPGGSVTHEVHAIRKRIPAEWIL